MHHNEDFRDPRNRRELAACDRITELHQSGELYQTGG
jgi:hypothetical protein